MSCSFSEVLLGVNYLMYYSVLYAASLLVQLDCICNLCLLHLLHWQLPEAPSKSQDPEWRTRCNNKYHHPSPLSIDLNCSEFNRRRRE